MRLATLEIERQPVVAVISDDGQGYVPVAELVPGFHGDMTDLIAALPQHRTALQGASQWRKVDGARWLPPIRPRRNIFCVGKNYHEHAKEFSQSGFDSSAAKGEVAPEAPVVFTKAPTCAIGHGATVERHAGVTAQLDYEAELGVIIGKAGRGIQPADAWSYVAGYTVINDVTARDLQHKHRQWFLGKSMDTFCPMGPWIVTADGIDGANLDVRCWVNGELRQDANTRDLIFDIPTLIATLSAGITLQPGDVIATGTPAGVGIGFKPPRFLQSGDEVRIEIQHVGTLVNRVG
jgi:2-keto-4-pentenoate hydratase/2-oxohepta-3-ene-1,7-dioic acid hydratase (catechol pathway)